MAHTQKKRKGDFVFSGGKKRKEDKDVSDSKINSRRNRRRTSVGELER